MIKKSKKSVPNQLDQAPIALVTSEPVEIAPSIPEREVIPGIEGPKIVEGLMFFARMDLVQMENHQLRAENALKELNLKEARLQKFISDAKDNIRKLEEDINETKKNMQEKAQSLRSFQDKIQRSYAIDLKSISYDEITGRIIVL